tara:strand:- start:1424 stop:1549 length:126 start_codon:yes stop_codon:yes gene_type:complete
MPFLLSKNLQPVVIIDHQQGESRGNTSNSAKKKRDGKRVAP